MPGATWIGPTVNEGDGDGRPLEPADAMGLVVGLVEHVQQGTERGTEAWQRNPASRVSSHFLLPRAGGVRQMVDTHDRSWCQVAGNRHWVSAECEGKSGQPLTAAQVEGMAQILAWLHQAYGVPLALANDPRAVLVARGGLAYHSLGGAAWGGHYNCPGVPIINQRPAIIDRARQILGGATVVLDPAERHELDDIDYTTTEIEGPDGKRYPLHVVLSKMWRMLARIDARTDPSPTDIAAALKAQGIAKDVALEIVAALSGH